MDSLAEWIGVGIAILGLFGGGYAGVRVGAVSRLRLERRLKIYDELLPALVSARFNEFLHVRIGEARDVAASAGKRPNPAAATDPQRYVPLLEAANSTLGALPPIDHQVELLPWIDRVTWARVKRTFPTFPDPDDGEDEMLHGLAEFFLKQMESPDEFPLDWHASTDDIAEYASAIGLSSMPDFTAATSLFGEHLRRQLRPGALTRLSDIRHRLRSVLSGPWQV